MKCEFCYTRLQEIKIKGKEPFRQCPKCGSLHQITIVGGTKNDKR